MIDKPVRPISILLIEDNPGDVREAPFQDIGRPDLILLDLNLPKVSGCEVLAEIKLDESLRRIPVVVLTTSDAEEDILCSYNRHAYC